MPRTILAVTLLPLIAIFTGCAVNDTSLGETDENSRVVDPSGTSGPDEDGGIGSSDDGGTCLAPSPFPVSDDAWWQATWSPSMPGLPASACGAEYKYSRGAAVVGVWTAPADGEYYARGWSDFKGVFAGGTLECGVYSRGGGACARLWGFQTPPQPLPEPPWDVKALPGGGFGTLDARAGDRYFFWFQYLGENNEPPPDSGIVVANISTIPFW